MKMDYSELRHKDKMIFKSYFLHQTTISSGSPPYHSVEHAAVNRRVVGSSPT